MENQIIPNVAQVWLYQFKQNNHSHIPYHIFVTGVLPSNIRRNYGIVKFMYLDTWEDDEMSLETFQKYCKLVSG